MKKAAAISLVLLTLTLCFILVMNRLRSEVRNTAQDALDTANNAMKLFKDAVNLTPQVRISSYVATQQTTDILELSTVKKQFPIVYTYSNTWLGSEKRLVLTGQYTVKAGFDLRDDFVLEIDAKTQVVHARFPQPKILSVQMDTHEPDVRQTDNGWWNKLSRQDQADAVNQMNAEARRNAEQMGILNEAAKALQTQLEDLARKSGQKWQIEFRAGSGS